jgi:hypothetical protein
MDEFTELFETFQTEARASLYLFCTRVTFSDDTVTVFDTTVSLDTFDELRSLFKKAKKKAFESTTTQDDAKKLIWFCCQKLLFATDSGSLAFDRSTRRELILLADMYIERT